MVKAIFFDIDGTLVSFKTHRISPGVLDGLRRVQEKGVKLFIATGRHWKSIGLAADAFPFDGCITVNGQYCFAGDQVFRDVPIAPSVIRRQVELLEESGAPCLFLDREGTLYVNPQPLNQLRPHIRSPYLLNAYPPVGNYSLLYRTKALYINRKPLQRPTYRPALRL